VRQQLTNSLKRKCDELITERPSKIIRKEIASNSHSKSLLQNDINRDNSSKDQSDTSCGCKNWRPKQYIVTIFLLDY